MQNVQRMLYIHKTLISTSLYSLKFVSFIYVLILYSLNLNLKLRSVYFLSFFGVIMPDYSGILPHIAATRYVP